ncbi:hypothetical protein LMK05_03885 [Lactococcus petauri]|nr:hypothetical protein LMK05_03885 [Lactococcus petauri]
MSKVIKCPVCSRTAELTYRENRVYRSECFNINCKEIVTVTAPSRVAAEELFSKFEKGTSQPKLSIPKKIADKLDEFYTLKFFDLGEADHWLQENDITSWKCETDSKIRFALVDAYLAGKALGVELVEVEE